MNTFNPIIRPVFELKLFSPFNAANSLFLGLLLLTVSFSSLHAQDPGGDLPFDSFSTGADGALVFPGNLPPVHGHAVAYDPNSNQVILFGGRHNQTNVYTNETWAFDGTQWTQLSPAASPPARAWHEMVYDGANDEIVLFGGYTNTTNELGDTWTWDGSTWTQESPTTSPEARYLFAMVSTYVDEGNQGAVFLYGGDLVSDNYDDQNWVWDGADWTQVASINRPAGRRNHGMAFDPNTGEVLLFGGLRDGNWNQETWTWDGTDWSQESPATVPINRRYHAMEYNPITQRITMFGGTTSNNTELQHTWEWTGTDWSQLTTSFLPDKRDYPEMVYCASTDLFLLINGSLNTGTQRSDTLSLASGDWVVLTGDILYFDMTSSIDPDHVEGIWNFTTIDVPNWVTIRFLKNPGNTPVFWLATGDININGILDLNGENAIAGNDPGNEAEGGPGGYAGGLGGEKFDVSDTYAGSAGQGPGGGLPGIISGEYGGQGFFRDTYGNASLIPLIGGSGGGGGASDATRDGGNGAGGGGAILLASSTDINHNGQILAKGGVYLWSGISYGGYGSGGAVRLVADRINGSGTIDVRGRNTSSPHTGYVRLEAYYRPLIDTGTITPAPTAGAPSTDPGAILPTDVPTLIITEVAGEVVAQPPTGSSSNPDVVFQESGAITVTVVGVNIPEGTPISLRIVSSGQIITLPGPGNPTVPLTSGEANFSVFVPAGLGNIQAFAEFVPAP